MREVPKKVCASTILYIATCQIAGVGRNEPDVGFVDYPQLFNLLDELGYGGWIGCEYRPLGNTLDGFDWYRKQER